ncbi:MAG: aldo/keto reductase [Myxococcales bacterium]|nr:aldo/keto reductase [Myxococcales bacterium]MBK7194727.1 aldo/keto reductase [Myxococcales bacterium]MBP6846381.1 aldo/keto reductase [Kofleriaceae bacterium]
MVQPPPAELPPILYGTAWKEERTQALTLQALAAGYRGIDTANQRKHYVEGAVGEAIAAGGVPRAELFLQTKFTYQRGQDHRLPYDPAAPLPDQVAQSFASSCSHLGTDVIDSYVLHGPWGAVGWSAEDRSVWTAMEALHTAGRIRHLGVSNIAAAQLEELLAAARVPPTFVQNRCYARTGWDHEVRAVCARHRIVYQGFSLLTANQRELHHPMLAAIGRRHGLEPGPTVFAFARTVGMLPLTGSSTRAHLDADLAAAAVTLTSSEVDAIARLGG